MKNTMIWAVMILSGAIVMSASCDKPREDAATKPATTPQQATPPPPTFRTLTPAEERVIVHKGTEAPFSGEYEKFSQKGTYTCKRCGAALYRSEDKFDAGCGWPSFDAEIPGAVKRSTDADGRRTEITCAKCGAHLGHVFTGEGFTDKDTRHCVNSISMLFVPAAATSPTTTLPAATGRAMFAGGCFWGMEYQFQNAPGVTGTRVGYAGGHKAKPTYEEVCGGKTGHLETLEVTFDPKRTNFEALAKLFFEIHDPTQANGQGPDIGEQYHSAIFCLNDEQRQTAEKLIGILKAKGLKVVTELRPAAEFWPAEKYHQRYYDRTGGTPYCHVRVKRF